MVKAKILPMKTNKTTRPTRQTQTARPHPPAPRPQPQQPKPKRPNDFFTLCFYPGMTALEFDLPQYPTAV